MDNFQKISLFFKDQSHKSQTEQAVYNYTSPNEIRDRIKKLASENRIGVKETTVVGFIPDEVHKMAYEALSQGNTMAWKTMKHYRM